MPDPDNVTRLPSRRPSGPDWSDPRTQVIVVYAMGVVSFGLFMSGRGFLDLLAMGLGVAAVIIAASKRDEGVPWARSHFTFALRTLVIAGALWTLLSLSMILIITIPFVWFAKWALGVWLVVRAAVGIVRALERKGIANPETMLV